MNSYFVRQFLIKLKKMLTFKNIVTTLFIFFILQQSVFAQSANKEAGMDTYSQFLIAMVIILIATLFIGLEILSNPKYEIKESTIKKKKINMIVSSVNVEYEIENKIIYLLKIGFFNIIILSLLYLLIIILMIRII